MAGPRVKLRRAREPLRRRTGAIGWVMRQLMAGTRSEPRKLVRLGLWPTTSRFSRSEYSLRSFWNLWRVASGASAVEWRICAS